MKYVPASFQRKVMTQVFKTKVHSPKILFATGLVGMAGTVVLACRATVELDEVLNDLADDIEKVENHRTRNASVSDNDNKKHDKALTQLRVKYGIQVVKLYAPAFGMGVVTVACLTKSHNIMSKRNFAMTAAYSGLQAAFEEYRQAVADELGIEKEAEFRHGVVVSDILDEKGKKIGTQTHAGTRAEYSFVFDSRNSNYRGHADRDAFWLMAQQDFMNLKLKMNNILLLNDVLVELGFPRTEAGCVVGWVYEQPGKDGYVDFGLGEWPSAKNFSNQPGGGVLLDFNCAGDVHELIGKV